MAHGELDLEQPLDSTTWEAINKFSLWLHAQHTLEDIQRALPQGMQIHRDLFRQADFIEQSLDNLFTAFVEGAGLVIIVVVVFLMNVRAAVITLVADDLLGPSANLVLTVELYVAAARDPALRAVTQDWMSRSRRSLERHLDPATAREVDALVEGLVLHSALSTDPMDAGQIRSALHRLAG